MTTRAKRLQGFARKNGGRIGYAGLIEAQAVAELRDEGRVTIEPSEHAADYNGTPSSGVIVLTGIGWGQSKLNPARAVR